MGTRKRRAVDPLTAGQEALQRGAWEKAKSAFASAVAQEPAAEALKGARFSRPQLDAIDHAKILRVRSGDSHRFIGVWVVVVEGRVFVRSWNDKQTGWFRAFLNEPEGMIQLPEQEIAVRGVRTRSARLQRGVTSAYAAKYNTKASQKWVRGFARPTRLTSTLELVPR